MVITLNGHLSAHFLQPVQESKSLITDDFFHSLTSRLSKCNGQAPTHHPHPVQRAESILGRNARRFMEIRGQNDWGCNELRHALKHHATDQIRNGAKQIVRHFDGIISPQFQHCSNPPSTSSPQMHRQRRCLACRSSRKSSRA